MMANILFSFGALLIYIGILTSYKSPTEPITLSTPAGYTEAKTIETSQDNTFVSALEYAQAFSPTIETAPPKATVSAPPPAKKPIPKRHIARSKLAKHKLVARR